MSLSLKAQEKAVQIERLRTLAAMLEGRVAELLADVTTLEAAITTMRQRYPNVPAVRRRRSSSKDITRARPKKTSSARARETA